MTASVRRLLLAVSAALAVAVVHEISARIVARHDLLGALLNRLEPLTLALAAVIVVSRALLLFAVPGFIVYRLACVFLDRTPTER